MKLVIAEKPSVARDLATFLGAKKKHDGYFEGEGVQVTWAFGHLVALKEPDEYDPRLKRWSLETLPFVPRSFELKLIKNPGVAKQFDIIKRLIKNCSELIEATDAGREGELIFRYILSMAGEEKRPFKRLWLTSLTDDAIKKGFETLKEGSLYDPLYEAARCRSESDWVVGLNATRNFTVRYGRGQILWSVGRVQTPVLAMLASRYDEIVHFTSEPFWELKTTYKGAVFKWKGPRFKKEEEARLILDKIKDLPFTIKKIESKEEKTPPPYLYDLTELQRDMNKRYGLSANDTLEIAQKLYEGKVISYPRTDSKFLSKDMKGDVVRVLTELQKIKPLEISKLNLQNLSFSSRIINDSKIEDHHAIIPTGKTSHALAGNELKVFDAIVSRFIAAFYPSALKNITAVEGEVEQEVFQVKGIQLTAPGWMAIYGKESDEEKGKEEEQTLPEFIVGEMGPHVPLMKEGKTEPPKHFTEATLLSAMETAGRFVEDEQLKEALKQKGLGTPATRASIIETLLKRKYIVREKKNIKITDLGRYLIAIIQDPNLKSPELTGEWEHKLKEIEKGKRSSQEFMQEIVAYIKKIIDVSRFSSINNQTLGNCPCCKRPIIEGKKGYGCSGWKEGCSFVLWKEYKGVFLTPKQARYLLQCKVILDPLHLPTGKVILCLNEKGKLVELVFPEVNGN